MRLMFADVRAVRLAGKLRWARETCSEVGCGLLEVGREDLLFELTNIELQLHELHLQLMQPFRQDSLSAPQQHTFNEREEVPF
jgi:hypothetical protein